MKPTRIRMCHSLVMNYGLYKKMEIFVSLRTTLCDRNRSGREGSQRQMLLTPPAREASYEARNVPVPYRRICRFPAPNNAR